EPGERAMKKLMLETTAPLSARAGGVRRGPVREGRAARRVDRPGSRRREEDPNRHYESWPGEPVHEPWSPFRAGQGGYVQRVRMGQLLPRPGHRPPKPPARAARHRR